MRRTRRTRRHAAAAAAVLAVAFLGSGGGAAGQEAPVRPEPLALSGETDRQADAAIEKGLRFLERVQNEDGSWGRENRIAMTAFCTIAFMVGGYFPGEEPYGSCLESAVDCLLKEGRQGMAGYMGTNMYAHGLATLALSEVWGQTSRDDEVREALKKAVQVILRSQSIAGGWRYDPYPSGADVSVTAMQLVALASARQAGILVPNSTVDRAKRYIRMCREETTGGFTYMPGRGRPAVARSAAAVVSFMMIGEHDAPEVRGAMAYLRDTVFASRNPYGAHPLYGLYYTGIAMYMSGDENFDGWYPKVRQQLLASQDPDGSWPHRGHSGGLEYSTSVGLIALGLPKGFVPAYQR